MKYMVSTVAALACLVAFAPVNAAQANSKQQQCEQYARNATSQTGTTTGVVRGAARGAVAGALLGGNAAAGARAGAVVGGTRRVAQKTRSYSYYYNSCMSK